MLVMSASDISKSYGIDAVLEDVSFSVDKGDRVGIVGPNGSGKTTLLSIIAGENSPSSGSVYIRSEFSVGYLKQKNHFFSGGTVLEEAEKNFEHFFQMEKKIERLAEAISDHTSSTFDKDLERYSALMEEYEKAGGYTYKSELKAMLKHMGFDEEMQSKKIEKLSGGERTRLALCCMLLKKPDILMLDEPTNHLDLSMLDWLEQYLKGYGGTILVVSHDRFFLDRIVNRIFDMSDGTLVDYRGNYSDFLVKKAERLEVMRREYEKQQKEIARQEEIIRRFKQHNTEHLVKRAQSREKRLAHLELVEKPKLKQERFKLSFDTNYKSGNDVIIAEDLCKSFGPRQLFRNASMDIKKGERICIIGDNGIGKTTLLRILIGQEQADDGYLKIGYNVDFGYYDQGQMLLDNNETVLGEMKNAYHLYTDTEMRSLLGRFLFFGDDVFKQVGALSGGEKAKLSMLKLMLSGANTLVLDEPTNHLDIESKEVVEEAIEEFEGTVIIVSHDRYLLNKIPDRILELTPSGIVEYKGRFDYYLEKKAMMEALDSEMAEAAKAVRQEAVDKAASAGDFDFIPLSAEEERQLRKKKEAEERRISRRKESLELSIAELELKIEELETEMCKPENATNSIYMREAAEKLEDYKAKLDDYYWEYMEI
ncbi:MAG: ABC-F family ATP-binding cassette domain-containing protein [Clostridiales bacterium]|nr:ABC-F family ATP-binding cassette domain-containing protein [Candidatus Crickella merdequi]